LSLFGSHDAETGTAGLASEFRPRLTDWRDETCKRALRVIMEAYEEERTGR
jgi:hypothetical protein